LWRACSRRRKGMNSRDAKRRDLTSLFSRDIHDTELVRSISARAAQALYKYPYRC
jgi:hypothetical protein